MTPEGEGLRDRLAQERTKLAIERTFLAYIRTALAFVVVGIPGMFMFESKLIQLLGGLSLFLGLVVVIFAMRRYAKVKRYLRKSIASDGREEHGQTDG